MAGHPISSRSSLGGPSCRDILRPEATRVSGQREQKKRKGKAFQCRRAPLRDSDGDLNVENTKGQSRSQLTTVDVAAGFAARPLSIYHVRRIRSIAVDRRDDRRLSIFFLAQGDRRCIIIDRVPRREYSRDSNSSPLFLPWERGIIRKCVNLLSTERKNKKWL